MCVYLHTWVAAYVLLCVCFCVRCVSVCGKLCGLLGECYECPEVNSGYK